MRLGGQLNADSHVMALAAIATYTCVGACTCMYAFKLRGVAGSIYRAMT